MRKRLYDKLEEIIKEIREWAKDDYESGHYLDEDDFNEFQRLLDDDDLNINRLLFQYYFDYFDDPIIEDDDDYEDD